MNARDRIAAKKLEMENQAAAKVAVKLLKKQRGPRIQVRIFRAEVPRYQAMGFIIDEGFGHDLVQKYVMGIDRKDLEAKLHVS